MGTKQSDSQGTFTEVMDVFREVDVLLTKIIDDDIGQAHGLADDKSCPDRDRMERECGQCADSVRHSWGEIRSVIEGPLQAA